METLTGAKSSLLPAPSPCSLLPAPSPCSLLPAPCSLLATVPHLIEKCYNLGASFAVYGTLIASQQTFLRLFPRWQAGTVSMGKIELEPGTDPEVIRAALNEYLPDDVHAFTHAEYIDFELNYLNRRSPIGFVFGLGSAMGLYPLTRKATALPIVLPLGRVVFVFALTILMCGFSGAIATRRLRSADPADIF